MPHEDSRESPLPAALEVALRSVAALGDRPWVVEPLAGGITNRNFRIDAGDETFVLRVAGRGTEHLGIDRGHEHLCAQAAAASGAGCEVIAFLPQQGAMLSRFAPGRVLAPHETEDPDVLARIVRALARFHSSGTVPGQFSAFRTIEQYLAIARKHRVTIPSIVDKALAQLASIESQFAAAGDLCPCHNDLLPANLIDDRERVWIIDWEYAAMGDRFFDLGNLAENHQMSAAAEWNLLLRYFGEARPHDLARLRMMRTASAMREAAWGFVQAGVSSLDFDFQEYAHRHLHVAVERLAANANLAPQPPA